MKSVRCLCPDTSKARNILQDNKEKLSEGGGRKRLNNELVGYMGESGDAITKFFDEACGNYAGMYAEQSAGEEQIITDLEKKNGNKVYAKWRYLCEK